jgi:hypothetical protein
VLVAPNGDSFVADGHDFSGAGGNPNARILKFDSNRKLIKSWGRKGSGPGGSNNRIQIFDQDGNFIDQWTQFSRPSGVYIDKNGVIYVADSESGTANSGHGAWKRGIHIGSARDGSVTAFITDPDENATTTSAAEGVTADAMDNIFGAEVGPKRMMKYIRR